MLLTYKAVAKWSSVNKKWYESKGYKYSKMGDEFEVRIEDLTSSSTAKINCRCDNCQKLFRNMTWHTYIKSKNDDGTYYCHDCAIKLYGAERRRKSALKNGKSFHQWCVENNRQDVLDRWDYELNKFKPSEINYKTNKKHYLKCPRGIHESEFKNINSITSKGQKDVECTYCNSFAQYLIDNFGCNALKLFWDYEKNIISPWDVSYGSHQKVWIKCQEKDYHGSYEVACGGFTNMDSRCPYCSHKGTGEKIHPLDSLGALYPNVMLVWSDRNKKSPYEYSPKSNQKVWWKCLEGKHEDYIRQIYTSLNYSFRCPECQYSKGEKRIENWLLDNGFSKNEDYIPQKEFNNLLGIRGRNLSYDFYLPNYNLLIEYQGEFHDGSTGEYTKVNLKVQQEHDRRKKEYAKEYRIKLLEIWYWDYDNIELILSELLI